MRVSSEYAWSLFAACVYAATAGAFVVYFDAGAIDLFRFPLAASAVLSAFLVGGATWYVLVERPERGPIEGGWMSGGVTGVVSHIPMFIFSGLSMVPEDGMFALLMMLTGFTGTLVASIVTSPLAAIAGVLIGSVKLAVISVTTSDSTS